MPAARGADADQEMPDGRIAAAPAAGPANPDQVSARQALQSLPVTQRVNALVKALNGARRTNEALARCSSGEEMLDVLLDASARLGLGLSREQLASTPPIRDWVWWKNKEALLTIGDDKPRYQQDGGQGRTAPQKRRKFLGLF
ncbi:MAG: hypothetical protein VKI63_03615 [Cyanobium sp.]|nr:hypothetical protein [Cyanobium sp.]